MNLEPISNQTDKIAKEIVDSAYCVHRELGPGLLESVYEACLCHELKKRNINFINQVPLPITYDGLQLDAALRLDLFVQRVIIVEIKAVEKMIPLYEAQLLTYMKLARVRLGLLINFNVPLIKDGIKRKAL